jgi:hypothetical protein
MSNYGQNPIPTLAAGPTQSKLNVSAAGVVKGSPGHIGKVIVVTAGSGGTFTLNDAATVANAGTANEIYTAAGTLAAATIIDFGNWPCSNGIVVSSMGTGEVIAISFT